MEFLVLTLLVTVVAMNVAGLTPWWYAKGGVLKCFLYGRICYYGMVSIDPSGKLAMVDLLICLVVLGFNVTYLLKWCRYTIV